jgi:hypothetical protein
MNEYVSVIIYTVFAILAIPFILEKLKVIQNNDDEDHYQNMNF